MSNKAKKANAKARVLRFESLENRQLLSASTFEDVAEVVALTAVEARANNEDAPIALTGALVVTTAADSGEGSLREAIANATDGSAIIFDASLSGETITLSSALPTIVGKSVTIDASDLEDGITIDGNGGDRIFSFQDSADHYRDGEIRTVALKNLTLIGTTSSAILASGAPNVSLENMTISAGRSIQMSARNVDDYSTDIPTLSIKNSTIENGAESRLYATTSVSNANVTIEDSVVRDNQSTALNWTTSDVSDCFFSIINSEFTNNGSATNAKPGVHVNSRAANATLTIKGSTFANSPYQNLVLGGVGLTATIEDSIVSGSSVGLVIQEGVVASATQTLVVRNGEGIVVKAKTTDSTTVVAETFFDGVNLTVADNANCGVRVDQASHVVLKNSIVAQNGDETAPTRRDVNVTGNSSTSSIVGTVVGYNVLSSFTGWNEGSENTSVYADGDPLFETGFGAAPYALAQYGEAVGFGDNSYVDWDYDLVGDDRIQWDVVDLGALESPYERLETPSLFVTTSEDVVDPRDFVISLREAILYAEQFPAFAEKANYTVSFADDLDTITLTDGELVVDQSLSFVGDVAVSAENLSRLFSIGDEDKNAIDVVFDGLTFANGSTEENGGAIFAGQRANVTVRNGAFVDNSAAKTGGAIYAYAAHIVLEDTTFEANEATTGGAIYQFNGTVSGDGVAFVGNASTKSGGAFYADRGKSQFADANFVNNEAGYYGGAIYATAKANVTLAGGSFTENASEKSGGAIFVTGGALTVETVQDAETGEEFGTTFDGNTSGTFGGALSINADAAALLTGATFTNNSSAGKFGGAIYASAATVGMTDVVADGNVSNCGGMLYAVQSNVEAINVTATNNTATGATGGAFAISNSQYGVIAGEFSGNTAKGLGGAIIAYASTGTVYDATFDGNSAESGGAIAVNGEGSLISQRATFANNTATANGGALYVQISGLLASDVVFDGNSANNGGGAYVRKADVEFERASFTNNSATLNGGGLFLTDAATTATIGDSLFADNAAAGGAGFFASYATFDLVNCTIASNDGSSAFRALNPVATIANSIIALNSGVDVLLVGEATANYTLSTFVDWTSGDNNLEYDGSALFMFGGYALVPGSQAVDAGDNDSVESTVDLAGATRIVNDVVDLGAYELQTTSEAVLDEAFEELFDENFVDF